MKHKIFNLLLVALLVVSASCHKKANEAAPSTCLLTNQTAYNGAEIVGIEPISVIDYDYNSENKLTTVTTYTNSNIMIPAYLSTQYTYDALGRIIKATVSEASNKAYEYTTYIYNANNTLATDTNYSIMQNGLLVNGYTIYYYDNTGKVTSSSIYYNKNETDTVAPSFFLYDSLTYLYDNNGNVLQQLYAGTPYSITYTYDDKPRYTTAADKVTNIPQSLCKNNVTSVVSNSPVYDEYTQILTYTYNANNYPVTVASAVTAPGQFGIIGQYKIPLPLVDTVYYNYTCH